MIIKSCGELKRMSVTIESPQSEFSLGPANITINNVQYYCHHARELKHTQVNKALKFIEADCIKYAGDGLFACEPLAGYNTRTYTMKKSERYFDTFECNCQGWITKEKHDGIVEGSANCSHILSLYFCFKMRKQFEGYEE
jgi:hypothetical protein